jgi:hypothetical protein
MAGGQQIADRGQRLVDLAVHLMQGPIAHPGRDVRAAGQRHQARLVDRRPLRGGGRVGAGAQRQDEK